MNHIYWKFDQRYAPSVLRTTAGTSTQQTNSTAYNGTNGTLEMTDFLMLMVEQFKNQTIDNTADTSDMMNQLVQMSVMESMTQVTTAIQTLTDANVLTYASSLVGKEVTLGVYNDQGELEEITGVVQATGPMKGSKSFLWMTRLYPEPDHGHWQTARGGRAGGTGRAR